MTPAGASAMLPVFEDREGKPRTAQLSQRLIKTGGALGSLLQASTKKAATSLKVRKKPKLSCLFEVITRCETAHGAKSRSPCEELAFGDDYR